MTPNYFAWGPINGYRKFEFQSFSTQSRSTKIWNDLWLLIRQLCENPSNKVCEHKSSKVFSWHNRCPFWTSKATTWKEDTSLKRYVKSHMTNDFLAIAWGMLLKHCSALSLSYLVCSLLPTDLHRVVSRIYGNYQLTFFEIWVNTMFFYIRFGNNYKFIVHCSNPSMDQVGIYARSISWKNLFYVAICAHLQHTTRSVQWRGL